ncbi:MAG: tryptophan--tRNA ligase [Anaerovoracaceae bacterium]|nr:tryptophan--tRNA ligase [Bacillota bacterium]MDY2670746.1 tryptophan--tRNA ligase [Anaerovoracaceae bacterium]
MKRVFSGIQPTGNIHLGNYLGALRQFVDLQKDNECIYCIVDMHAITVPKDPEVLKKSIMDVAALYLALGIDPEKSIVFIQSDVPGHAELSWMLTCSSYTGELSRMTQFKQKSKMQESAPTGLFMYPVLMAADILLYDTEVVPVGDDQKQHIELTRDLAKRVNGKYGEDTFVIPEGRYMKSGARIMSLDDPSSKMSKSAENEYSRIQLLDSPSKIKKSIMRATTDSEGVIRYDQEKQPGIANLLNIYSACTNKPVDEIVKDYDGKGYGALKKDLVDVLVENLTPVQERFAEIRNSDELPKILAAGAEKANAIAEKTIKRVKDNFGLGNRF